MSNYLYTITVLKQGAFNDYITANLPQLNYINSTPTTVDIFTTVVLTTAQVVSLTTLVNAYVDPAQYLTLSYQLTDSSNTVDTNTTSLSTVKTFIQPASITGGDGTFNTFKMIIKYSSTILTPFLTNTACTFTIQLFCETRQLILQTVNIDVSPVVTAWKTAGIAPAVTYQTLMIDNLRSLTVDYDSICSIRGMISNPNVYFSLHSLQSLFYNIQ
jgi:hypothetical protein